MSDYIEFNVLSEAAASRITALFYYIKEKKNMNDDVQIEDLEYDIFEKSETFFTKEELNRFWWPTEEESKLFWDTYKKLPQPQKTQHLESVPWDFETAFSEIGIGDYIIKDCYQISDFTYRLSFEPIGYPFGGTQPLKAVLSVYQVEIIKDSYEEFMLKMKKQK